MGGHCGAHDGGEEGEEAEEGDGIAGARALTILIMIAVQVWLAISGIAYDVTEFLAEHPGGEEVVMEVTGAGCCSHSPFKEKRSRTGFCSRDEFFHDVKS